jgi:hypothetical protein
LKGGNITARKAIPARERLAKTGWSTYPVWIGHPYDEDKTPAQGKTGVWSADFAEIAQQNGACRTPRGEKVLVA